MHLVRSHGTTFIEPLVSCPRSLYIRTPPAGFFRLGFVVVVRRPFKGRSSTMAKPRGSGFDVVLRRRCSRRCGADLPWRSCIQVLHVFFWQIYEFAVFLMVSLDPFSDAYDHVSWIRSSVGDCSCSMGFLDRTCLL
ncbi:unnamed protein product [Musa textilis]